jgi:hypothetical protein
MKKWIVVLMLLMVGCAVSQAKNMNAWVLGGDNSFLARGGYSIDPNIEVGISGNWYYGEPQVVGAYGLIKWTDVVVIPNPMPLDFLPKELHGTPYLGIRAGLNLMNENGTFAGPFAGIIVEKVLVFEYQFNTNFGNQLDGVEENKVVMGFRFQF